jgi:fructose-1,6-bisphosphatase/inositol monophosphatase family enzyme
VTAPETSPDHRPLLDLARTLALEGAALIAEVRSRPYRVDTKTSAVDMVTEADRLVEQHITSRLLAIRPDDGLLGEEGANREGASGVRWVIDPIDGTTNFVYGIPGYAISIGVEVEGERVAGVVHDVLLNETFAAARGFGATLNGNPIEVSTRAELATALIGTGFAYSAETRGEQARVLTHVMPRVRDIRRRGSAALDLCWVACGRLDGYFERDHGGAWDIAAAEVILREAGGVLGGLHGAAVPPSLIMAAGPALYEPLRGLLIEAGAR